MALRKSWCGLVALLLAVACNSAHAQGWPAPSRTLNIIVPYSPGNITDIAARVVAQKITDKSGRPAIVLNRTGGSSQVATGLVARADPDGHTLLMTGPQFSTNQALFSNLPYDSEKDLVPVALVVTNPLVLVTGASKPYKTARDLIEYARANPGKVTMGSGGNGVLSHMAMALMSVQVKAEMIHVPYRGGAPAAVDTVSGQIDSMWDNLSSAIPLIQGGNTRPLAVSSKTRNPALPDVPSLAEVGYPDFETMNWFGLFAPSKTDPDMLRTIHAEVMEVLALPEVRERFARDGVQTGNLSQKGFADFVQQETRKWGQIIRQNNIKVE